MVSNHTSNYESSFTRTPEDTNLEKLILDSMGLYPICDLHKQIKLVIEMIKHGTTKNGYDGKDRKISPEIICFLCTSPGIANIIGHFGLYLKSLKIIGELDLRSAIINFRLRFENCDFNDGIVLKDAETRSLEFDKGYCRYFVAPRIHVNGKLQLCQLTIHEGVELHGAEISGYLDLAGTQISPIKGRKSRYRGKALILNRASIGGGLWFMKEKSSVPNHAVDQSGLLHAKITGEVSLLGAIISGDLDCRKAKFTAVAGNPGGKWDDTCALRANLAEIKGNVYLDEGFVAEGLMLMKRMNIHGDLSFNGGSFYGSSADRQEPRKPGDNANDSKTHAISLDRSTIQGSVFMGSGCTVTGQVRMIGVTIMKDLDCSGGTFLRSIESSPKNDACSILIPRSDIHGDACFKGDDQGNAFTSDGMIVLTNTKIGGNLDFSIRIIFRIFDSDINANHGIMVKNCAITGNIICWLRQPDETPGKNGFTQKNLDKYNKNGANRDIIIDLSDSQAGGLDHSWNFLTTQKDETRLKELKLERFLYDRYEEGNDTLGGVPYDPIPWIKYLQKKNTETKTKSMSARHHLGMILLKKGERALAEDILMQVERDKYFFLAESAGDNGQPFRRLMLKLFSWIGDKVLGYGYRTINATKWILVFIIIGCIVFEITFQHDGFCLIKPDTLAKACVQPDAGTTDYYVHFNSLVFSIDNLFSFGNFSKISDYWGIKYDETKDWLTWLNLAHVYLWFHRVIGWLLIPLSIAGISTAVYSNKNLPE